MNKTVIYAKTGEKFKIYALFPVAVRPPPIGPKQRKFQANVNLS